MTIEGHGHFLNLIQGHLHMKIKLAFFSETTEQFSINLYYACRYKLMKIHLYNAGHMAKMAAMPIYGKTL